MGVLSLVILSACIVPRYTSEAAPTGSALAAVNRLERHVTDLLADGDGEFNKPSLEEAVECLKATKLNGVDVSKLEYPSDAEEHLQQIKDVTAAFNTRPHCYISMCGPWIENIWIEGFSHEPLTNFGPYIPIFAQFTDLQVKGNDHLQPLCDALLPLLRPNVLYITVSQHDKGLPCGLTDHKNVLVFSGGGVGNIPIPLLPGRRPLPLAPARHTGVFWKGLNTASLRPTMEQVFSQELQQSFHSDGGTKKHIPFNDYRDQLNDALFAAAPRGWGRSSFRLYEAAQAGKLPIYVYKQGDPPWLPYTKKGINQIDWLSCDGSRESLTKMAQRLKKMKPEEVKWRLKQMEEHRQLFTAEGVMEEIGKFMIDQQQSALSCSSYENQSPAAG